MGIGKFLMFLIFKNLKIQPFCNLLQKNDKSPNSKGLISNPHQPSFLVNDYFHGRTQGLHYVFDLHFTFENLILV